MKAFIHFARDKFGRVDVIFNNAGVMPLSPMNALKVEEWDTMINVNINGVLNGIAAGLPIMEAQGRLSILRPLPLMWWCPRGLLCNKICCLGDI